MYAYDKCSIPYFREVNAFKKDLLRRTLEAHKGHRTRAALALGLQRTYLHRLIRDFRIDVPPSAPLGRGASSAPFRERRRDRR